MPITFGSVGDIVATIQVAAKLLEILSASRGSARDFQELVVELRTYHRALDNARMLRICYWRAMLTYDRFYHPG